MRGFCCVPKFSHGGLRFFLRQAGFSLYDLIITSAVAGVVSIGAASMASLVQDTRMTSEVNELMTQLSLARSEAIKRGTTVTLCKSDNGVGCARGSEWHKGWIVFVNDNDNHEIDEGETIIRIKRPSEGAAVLNFAAALNHDNYITYKPNGEGEPNGTFTFCDGRGSIKAKAVIVNSVGRPRSSTKDRDNKPLKCSQIQP